MPKFFDRYGKPLSAEEALDANGCIKDGVRQRVSLADSKAARTGTTHAHIVDGSGTLDGLHRPGFRLPGPALATDAACQIWQDRREEAYREWERRTCNAYRNPDDDDDDIGEVDPGSEIDRVVQRTTNNTERGGAPAKYRTTGMGNPAAYHGDDPDEIRKRAERQGREAGHADSRQHVADAYEAYRRDLEQRWRAGK